MARTTAQRSATAKAAAARRQADQDAGIPSIAALAAELHADKPWRSKAEARREAVRRIEAMRADVAAPVDQVAAAKAAVAERRAVQGAAAARRGETRVARCDAKAAHRRAVTQLAAELHADKPWRSKVEARREAERRLADEEGDDAAALVAAAQAAYRARLQGVAQALLRR